MTAPALRLRTKLGALIEKAGGMAKFRRLPRAALFLYRLAVLCDSGRVRARREIAKSRPRAADELQHIHALILGTTGLCNASCIHCPTGKSSTAESPRRPMSMAVFRKIIDGVSDEGLAVAHVGFGLFGDGLLDPLVVERARYLRQKLPDAPLAVNTNGAAYNRAKHAPLFELVNTLALHCESLQEATFDRLMAPLRACNLRPKYEAILRDFPDKVRVSVPVSRANLDELESLRDWFMRQGAREVSFDAMTNRCVADNSIFNALALSPVRIRCAPGVTRDLIVDCDGVVVPCCNDFAREQPIGNLTHQGFRETLTGAARREFSEKMRAGAHDDIGLCSRCFGDIHTANFPFDQLPATVDIS